ncbi:hypothetical protein CLAFUW4_10657 [Fulvia fulva]|uniref:Uncharacterized protein n=1 Tax=Passalora fulva TaxID=5499 RepID=A0A9Q8LGF2_PASFU|nr:uncharacterized protein CLAFUR5_05270 [Fulvia fulva]KAK4616141.1 hypothetical protein CLAFUR4_10662 [Fulvia fulva]KAK4616389.1 hypothetical protein CLAFUR0_10581 [Fulvia fulva]UJO16969.1 hypothetical protein CLAFUR5_05270 [Fulvia fulva]WPV18868.1 hypothetical protein CLAFUW4_10657 [Fulvia fulva]WPV34470.1 hypothetical protein CLAFUW7_10659 [Fulvia fulva]
MSNCIDFCCSDFKSFDEPPFQSIEPLQNAIHPLFAFSQFENVTQQDYDVLLTLPLRLASRCLKTDAFVKYAVIMTHGDLYTSRSSPTKLRRGRKVTWAEIDAPGYDPINDVALIRCPNPTWGKGVSPTMRTDSSNITNALRRVINFAIAPLQDGCGGETLPVATTRGMCPVPDLNRGGQVRIEIAQIALDEGRRTSSNTGHEKYRWCFHFARVVLHELAHGINYVANGDRSVEVYFKNSPYSEAGFDLEGPLFGGIFFQETLRLPFMVPHDPDCSNANVTVDAMREWPSGAMAWKYISGFGKFGNRITPTNGEIIYHVPSQAITTLFDEGHWRDVLSTHGGRPLIDRRTFPRWVCKWHCPCDQRGEACTCGFSTRIVNTPATGQAEEAGSTVAEDADGDVEMVDADAGFSEPYDLVLLSVHDRHSPARAMITLHNVVRRQAGFAKEEDPMVENVS